MKVAYLVSWRGGHRTGPFQKVCWQVQEWERFGVDAAIFVVTSAEASADWAAAPRVARVAEAGGGLVDGIRARRTLVEAARDWGPDVVYERHGLWFPGLGRLTRSTPTVLEVSSDDVQRLRTDRRIKRWGNRLTRQLELRRAAGVVFVSRELATHPRFRACGPQRLVLGNSIRLGEYDEQPAPTRRHAPPNVVFIGHPGSPWHGLDQVALLAAALPQWSFQVIGPSAAELPEAPPNIRFHGELARDQYLPVLQAADVALGPLALHRLGSAEQSTLKVREYLACGLPVILCGGDTDFPSGADFLHTLPARDGAVVHDLSRLVSFVETWQGRRVRRAEVQHLDVSVKERRRMEFLVSVARTAGR